MSVLDRTGDTKIEWNSDNKDEIKAAKDHFKKLKKKGYIAYNVGRGCGKGSIITEFDADAEEIIMAPPTAWG